MTIDVLLVSEPNLTRRLLVQLIEAERDIRIAWCGRASELDQLVLNATGAIVSVVCDSDDSNAVSPLDRFRNQRESTLVIHRNGDLSNGADPGAFYAGFTTMCNPFGEGPQAWHKFRLALLRAIRQLAGRPTAGADQPASPGKEVQHTRSALVRQSADCHAQPRILVVDDEKSMRRTLSAILRDEGYRVATACTGEEAVESAAHGEYRCVLMDVRMPGIDGLETLRLIRRYGQGVPVILMSAFASEALKEAAQVAGAAAFVEKPLDIEKLLQLIRDC